MFARYCAGDMHTQPQQQAPRLRPPRLTSRDQSSDGESAHVSISLVTMAVPTTDALRAYWDSFAVDFERDVEQEVIPVTRGMFSSLGLHTYASFCFGCSSLSLHTCIFMRCLSPIHLTIILSAKNASVLELGGGAGGAALDLYQLADSSVKITVTDLSPKMIEQARKKLPEAVTAEVADAEHLSFPNSSFDFVYGNLCLQIVPDPDQVLKEVFRGKSCELICQAAQNLFANSPQTWRSSSV